METIGALLGRSGFQNAGSNLNSRLVVVKLSHARRCIVSRSPQSDAFSHLPCYYRYNRIHSLRQSYRQTKFHQQPLIAICIYTRIQIYMVCMFAHCPWGAFSVAFWYFQKIIIAYNKLDILHKCAFKDAVNI